nr:hypothetical protein [Clostridia bacterium]
MNGKSSYDAIELDYDGHRWVNGVRENVHTYIVFSPTQIKSATDNVGNFAPDNPDIRYSLRDMPEEISTREFLSEADDSIADTVEERNALSIYQKLLKNHAAASEAVTAAEEALERAAEADKPEARKALTAARAKQKDITTAC